MIATSFRQVSIPFFALVLFGTAPLAFVGSSELKPFAQNGERSFSRMIWFGENPANPVAGEFWIDYGRPEWKPEYDKQVDEPSAKRWRFGKDAWTSLDTNVELQVGGQKVAPGIYYAALEHTAKDKWGLVFLDPAPLRASRMDAFGAAGTQGGIVAPLTHATGEAVVDKLTIEMKTGKKANEGTIEITFGTHKLSVPFTAKV